MQCDLLPVRVDAEAPRLRYGFLETKLHDPSIRKEWNVIQPLKEAESDVNPWRLKILGQSYQTTSHVVGLWRSDKETFCKFQETDKTRSDADDFLAIRKKR